MTQPECIRIRPGYGSQLLLVEFCGDHRGDAFPDVRAILQRALHAEAAPLDAREVSRALSTDCYAASWIHSGGCYLIDDDIGGLWIHCEENNRQVVGDIEQALLQSGLFTKEEVDFGDYA
jgi:hypothetical protein